MNEPEIEQLADSWIAQWEADEKRAYDFENPSASEIVTDLYFDNEHEKLWKFVLAAYPKEMSRRVFAVLAAGPLEDLLAHFGPIYIDRVETLARQDQRFSELLGGVWKSDMTDEVWERVERARNVVW